MHELKGTSFSITTSREFDVAVEDSSKIQPKKVTSAIKKKGKDDGLRTKVLIEVNEDFHDATLIVSILESGMIEELVVCFEDKDNVIRELASRAIMQVASVERGREYIVTHKLVVPVAKLFEDDVVKIRQNAYLTL